MCRDGKISAVFCGSPNANFSYTEGFAFLNETRKKQLTDLLKRANALPIYTEGDAEICLRAGYLNDGTLLAAIFEIGIDPLDELTVYLEEIPKSIEMMLPDGTLAPVSFTANGDGLYTLEAKVETLYPVVLLIK